MPYNRMYNELLPPENETMSDLTRTLIGIQMRREEKARQAKLDALFEERQRQMMQMAQDEQQAKAADILASIAAAGDRPKEQLPPVQMPVSAPSTPSDMAAFDLMGTPGTTEPNAAKSAQEVKTAATQPIVAPEVSTPTPINRFQFGGRTIEQPLFDRGETMARQAESIRAAKLASGGVELTPELIASMPEGPLRDVLQMFAGSIQEPPNLSSTLAAQVRNESNVGAPPKTENIGGRLKGWNPTTKRFDVDYGPAGDPDKPAKIPADNPPKTETIGGRLMGWNPATKKFDIDYGAAGRAVTVTSGQMAQNRTSALQAMGKPADTTGDTMWALTNRIFTTSAPKGGMAGVRAKVGGIGDKVGAATGYSPDPQMYKSQVRGFIPLFARAVGHTGVLTEMDVQRTEALFPQFGESKEMAQRKMTRLNAIMAGKEPMPDGVFEPREGHWPPNFEASPAKGGGVGDSQSDEWEEVAPGIKRRKRAQ